MPKQSGEAFLHERNTNVHKSREVEDATSYMRRSGEKIPNSPAEKLGAHIRFLNEVVNDGLLTGDQESISRQVDHLTIRPDDVPQSYFDLQKKIARERGHGDIDITPSMRDTMIETIREEQTQSLESWANYLTDASNDTTYPDWFKKYAFEAMTKLGPFDKEKSAYTKRSRGTTAPFADLNAEALAYVYDAIDRHALQGIDADDEKAASLVKSGNFAKLYAHAMMEVTPASAERREITAGSWTKYDQIEGEYDPDYDFNEEGEASDHASVDNEDAMRLAKSLQGHGTGWCTAGARTAAHQLTQGDFYVYYSQDEGGSDTVPRIAIRMERGRVAEVRGIEHDQNLEGNMTDIAKEKLSTLSGGEEYLKIVADMKRLTEIDKHYHAGEDLTVEDIMFLRYSDIEGFGYKRDPRIDNLLKLRDSDKDLTMLIEKVDNMQLAQVMALAPEGSDFHRSASYNLVSNLDKFELSIEDKDAIGLQLIEDFKADCVAPNLNKFYDKVFLAQAMIEYQQPYALSDVIENMDDPSYLVDGLIDYGSSDFITSNLDKFEPGSVDHALLAQHLIEEGKFKDLINNLDKFEPGSVDHAMLVDKTLLKGESGLIGINLDKFEPGSVDHALLAQHLIEEGFDGWLIAHLDKFELGSINFTTLVEHLVDTKQTFVFRQNAKIFKHLIDQRIISNWYVIDLIKRNLTV